MNHPALKTTGFASAQPERTENTVSLRVVDRNAIPEWSLSTSVSSGQTSHCLLYLVALENPTIRSSRARRLRLKDSLAGGGASRNAGILARDPHFWDYLQQINLTAYDAEIDARRARHFINRVCGVNSRHELDRENPAAERFYQLIEQPFLDWLFAGK